MKKIPLKRIVAIAIFLVLFTLIVVFSGVYTDYIELREIGENFTEVFWRDFNVNAITMMIAFLVFFMLVLSNLLIIRNNLISLNSAFSYLKKVFPLVIISVFVGIIFADMARRHIAHTFLPFLTSEWFNLGDPIFHQDVGYYIFQRPFYNAVINILLSFGVFFMFFTALTYFVLYSKYDFYNVKNLMKVKGVIVHQIASVVIYFLIKATSYRYQSENILFEANKEYVGGSYIDIHVWIQFYRVLPILLIVIVILTIIFTLNSKYLYSVMTVMAYPIAVVIVMLVAQVMYALVVSHDEFSVESEYIQNNINFTRAAYGLNNTVVHDFNVEYNLTDKDVMNNLGTINNIRLIDYNQTLGVANQIQSLRNYYHFINTDIVPYEIDGRLTAVAVSARELAADRLEDSAKNYINTKMRYTHGMGLVMNSVNRVTEQGQPYFTIRDIPPRSLDGTPVVKEPRIYFGENMRGYVIVGTRDEEYDEIETGGYTYSGSAGIQLTFLNRLIYAMKHGDFKLLLSDQISMESKLLTNRIVLERVKMAAPFLTFDDNIYLLIDNKGRLKWIVDGYTTSKWFPYSQYSGDINYIRNSVKAVVDAYDGTVKFYVTDEDDPIIQSFKRIYPTLFEQTGFPQDLARHMRYPGKIFKMQASLLKRYHIENASDFYARRDVWASSREKYEGNNYINVDPYYNIMKIIGEDKEEFVLMQPFTPMNRDNMVAWLAARSGSENYGQLVVYNFKQNENVYGPYQIENKIDNDPIILQELSQLGDSVLRGNLIVVPVKNSILYVEPIYTVSVSNGGRIAEIKRVIVAYGEKVVIKPTLDEALNALFGVNRPTILTTNDELIEDVILRTLQSFEDMKLYSKENDWENYGKSLKELDDNMQALREKSKEIADSEEIPLTEE